MGAALNDISVAIPVGEGKHDVRIGEEWEDLV